MRTRRPTADDAVLGNRTLDRFDVCIIGSGAAGGTAAHVLTAAGRNVLVLETGHNPWPGLDDPDALPLPRHSNDELKYTNRAWLDDRSLLEPRTWRQDETQTARILDDVNTLPKVVGGAFQHSPCTVPRFTACDLRMKSAVEERLAATPGLHVPGFGTDADGANFADWPFGYDALEPFYAEMEDVYGVQGEAGDPFESGRSTPHPMPPGVPMYANLLLAEGARRTLLDGQPLHPHPAPTAVNSRPRDGRPPCNDCGPCSGFGCPNNAKGSPAVTSLRRALLSGRCQLRHHAHVVRLVHTGSRVTGVEYLDADGALRTVAADAYVLAASAIESARLCLDSGDLGNANGLVGRNLMFHFYTSVNGFWPRRLHGQRGRTNSHSFSDFRGVEPGGALPRVFRDGDAPVVALGGVCDFNLSQGLIINNDADVYTRQLPRGFGQRFGLGLKNALRDGALGQHLLSLSMVGEDAPQLTNRVDLDPSVRDVFGRPVARVTYRNHAFELAVRRFYVPHMRRVLENAGLERIFTQPCDAFFGDPPLSRHLMGTLRMGTDPATSVVDAGGRFHGVENLWACDGSVFPTSSGFNPTMTIIAVAAKIARGMG